MAMISKDNASVLEQPRARTQIDADTFDAEAIKPSWHCTDATFNPIEIFTEISKPNNQGRYEESIHFALSNLTRFDNVPPEKLAADVIVSQILDQQTMHHGSWFINRPSPNTVKIALRVTPKIEGCVHVMVSPKESFNTQDSISQCRRFHDIAAMLDRSFDQTRLVTKIAATWEGLTASSYLEAHGFKTLVTAVFTREQYIMAGEAGCTSVSPFIHELKALTDARYDDHNSARDLCLQAQAFYQKSGMKTEVKACATNNAEEIKSLYGIAAFTLPTGLLHELDTAYLDLSTNSSSILRKQPTYALYSQRSRDGEPVEIPIYTEQESKWRYDFSRRDGGQGQYRLWQVLMIFDDYQEQLYDLIRTGMERHA